MGKSGGKVHLPKQCEDFIRLIGMKATVRLLSEYGGVTIYIPKLNSIEKEKRRLNIIREFDGKNASVLARKYGVSNRNVQLWVKEKREELNHASNDCQGS